MIMATSVIMRPITAANWQECINLRVAADQTGFVPGNLYSIAEAQFYPDACSQAIYSEAGQMVGYALWGRDDETHQWKIFRIMVDAAHQGRGYGRAAMHQLIDAIRQRAGAQPILICYKADNAVAQSLYASLGFVEQSIDERGKVTAQLA